MDVGMYQRGSLFWYVNRFTKKSDYGKENINQDFTTSRPVIIISNETREICPLSTVQCVICTTSSKRIGIPFDSYDYTGEHRMRSLILPYTIKSVPKDYLKNYQGTISAELLDRIYSAIDYYQGRSNTIPDLEHLQTCDLHCDIPDVSDVNISHNIEKSSAALIPVNKPGQESQSIAPHKATSSLSKKVLEKYNMLDYGAKIKLVEQNSIMAIENACNIAHNTARKVLEYMKTDIIEAQNNFIEYANNDIHRMKFLNDEQSDILISIPNERLVKSLSGYSPADIDKIKSRYLGAKK